MAKMAGGGTLLRRGGQGAEVAGGGTLLKRGKVLAEQRAVLPSTPLPSHGTHLTKERAVLQHVCKVGSVPPLMQQHRTHLAKERAVLQYVCKVGGVPPLMQQHG